MTKRTQNLAESKNARKKKECEGEGEAVHQVSAENPNRSNRKQENGRQPDPPKRHGKEGHLSIDQTPVKINLCEQVQQ